MKAVLETDGVGGCTNRDCPSCHRPGHLEMAMVVNFVLCVFHHNFLNKKEERKEEKKI